VAIAAALVLAGAPPAFAQAVEKRAEACFECHGRNGTSATALTPSLGAQPSFFVVAQLFLSRDGRRPREPTPMDAFARGLTDDDLRAFGELVAKLPPPAPPSGAPDAARLARARALVEQRKCGVCHNPDFSGRDQMPRLANQREDYLLKAMSDYRSGNRIGYGNAAMAETVAGLGDAELADLAHFLAHFPTTGTKR
jgi:cytochrome c553